MATLIIYGIVIAALVGGAFWIKDDIEEIGEDRILLLWGPLIDKCKASDRSAAECAAEWTSALAANLSLQADVEVIRKERDFQSGEVKKLELLGEQAQIEKAKRNAANASKISDLETDAAAMKAFISTKKASATCEDTVATIDTTLRDLALRRVLGLAPAADSDGGKVAPASPSAGPSPLPKSP